MRVQSSRYAICFSSISLILKTRKELKLPANTEPIGPATNPHIATRSPDLLKHEGDSQDRKRNEHDPPSDSSVFCINAKDLGASTSQSNDIEKALAAKYPSGGGDLTQPGTLLHNKYI